MRTTRRAARAKVFGARQSSSSGAYFGGVKRGGKSGRGSPGKSMVVVAVEVWNQGAGRMRMKRIKHADKPTLHGFIKENIEPGSTVITDGWWHYKGIEKLGYTHDRRIVKGSKSRGLPSTACSNRR